MLVPAYRPSGPDVFPVTDGRVIVWSGALPGAVCDQLAAMLPPELHGGPHRAPELARALTALVEPWLFTWRESGRRWRDEVTFTTSPLGWHRDVAGATWKVAIYLDERVDGGTIFDRVRRLAPASPRGTVVAFSPRIEHCSASSVPKRVLGLRADDPRC